MNNSSPDIGELIRAGQVVFRRELASESLDSAKRLQYAYRDVLGELGDAIANLEDAARSQGATTRGLAFSGANLKLQQDVRQALNDFSTLITGEADKLQNQGIEIGALMGETSLTALVGSGFNQPSVEQIKALINYVDSPAFRSTLTDYGGYHAQQASDIILTAASLGRDPLTAARQVATYLTDMPLADAVRMTSTVMLWSARGSQHQTYRDNADVVESWIWSSAKDSRTCLSCIAMEGQEFPLDETLNDHFLGRCTPIPKTKDWAALGVTGGNPSEDMQSGEDWFGSLPESQQRDMMGTARWMAWQDGVFQFGDLSKEIQSAVYGPMRTEASLNDLVGSGLAAIYRAKGRK